MSKFTQNRTVPLSLICAALMFVLLICQFTPFWTVAETGETVSVSGYVWMPTEHGDLDKQLSAQLGDGYSLNGVVGAPILMLVLSAAGTILCIVKANSPFTALLPAACGLSGLIGILCTPALRLGSGWVLQLILCAAMLTVAAVQLLTALKEEKKNA